jgi:hypothetical protein
MKKFTIGLVFLLALGIASASASVDTVDWSQLGPSFTTLSTPQGFTSTGGITGIVGLNDFDPFQLRQQGNGWNGNFTPGETILWNQDQAGLDDSIVAIFTTGNYGGGAQIQADAFGAFSATLNVYDTFLSLIATVNMTGNSNPNGDGSAIFIGYQSNSANIGALQFLVSDVNGANTVAIGTMSIYTSSAVPEPGSLVMFGSGIIGLAGILRRKINL